MKSQIILAVTLAASLAAGAAVSQGAPPPKPRMACAADIQHFCPGATGKDAKTCLRSHMAEVSPDCQSAMQAAKAMHDQKKSMGAAPAGEPPPGSPPPQ